MFRASWAWVCVWGKFCKFLKNQNQIFWEDPLCKKSKTFFILVSPDITDTFLFHKIFGWSKFSRVWVWICVCRRSKNRQKKRPKSVKKACYGPPSGFPLTSTWPGIVHHLSGPNIYALRTPNIARMIGSRGSAPVKDPPLSRQATLCFHCAVSLSQTNGSHTC